MLLGRVARFGLGWIALSVAACGGRAIIDVADNSGDQTSTANGGASAPSPLTGNAGTSNSASSSLPFPVPSGPNDSPECTAERAQFVAKGAKIAAKFARACVLDSDCIPEQIANHCVAACLGTAGDFEPPSYVQDLEVIDCPACSEPDQSALVYCNSQYMVCNSGVCVAQIPR